jgi:hypothetical protein
MVPALAGPLCLGVPGGHGRVRCGRGGAWMTGSWAAARWGNGSEATTAAPSANATTPRARPIGTLQRSVSSILAPTKTKKLSQSPMSRARRRIQMRAQASCSRPKKLMALFS